MMPAQCACLLLCCCHLLLLSPLLQDSINAPLIAAVRDFGLPCGHAQLPELPPQQQQRQQQQSRPYFNAGLLLYNLAAWREKQQAIEAALPQFGFEVIDSAQTTTATHQGSTSGPQPADAESSTTSGGGSSPAPTLGQLPYHDQDALNLLCGSLGGWVELEHRWNVQVRLLKLFGCLVVDTQHTWTPSAATGYCNLTFKLCL